MNPEKLEQAAEAGWLMLHLHAQKHKGWDYLPRRGSEAWMEEENVHHATGIA